MPKYYTIIKEKHDVSCACCLEINWNTTEITGKNNADGYIVQKFSRKLFPKAILPVEEYCDISYFEAWKVQNGKIVYVDKNTVCDDRFSIGNCVNSSSEINYSLGTKGCFEFSGDIYWIPNSSPLYTIVDHWSDKSVKQANGLKASYDFKEIKGITPVFSRALFIHEWDLSSEEKIYCAVKSYLFKLCPNNSDRDEWILKTNASEIFKDKYTHIMDSILEEWNNQWID